jgi:hypothetical protein
MEYSLAILDKISDAISARLTALDNAIQRQNAGV